MSTKFISFMRYIIRLFYGNFLIKKYGIEIINKELLDNANNGSIFLSNHAHALDPLFPSVIFPYHIRWVAGSHLFKKFFSRILFKNLAACISKGQGRNDLATIRELSKALKEGSNVGLFPEGTRTWDGEYVDSGLAVAKLLKLLKSQVVIMNLETAFVINPRWADYRRKGKLFINIKKIITAEELKNLSIEEIDSILKENLAFSFDAWQEEHMTPYFCKKSAEGINRLFYLCPKCNAIETIQGKGNEIICTSCGTKDTLDPYSRLSGNFGYTKLSEWNNYQKEKITGMSFNEDKGKFIHLEGDKKDTVIVKNFTAKLNSSEIIFTTEEGKVLTFKFENIKTFVISVKQTIEIFYKDEIYVIRLNKNSNVLKYHHMYQLHCKGEN